MRVALLVVAKMPVPGEAKTRLAAEVGDVAAADLAAAALLDTLDAVAATGMPCVVARTGALDRAAGRRELEAALADATVVRQRGSDFASRLAAAHHDAARRLPGHRIVQIGMDTPQVTAELLHASARTLSGSDAVIGPASDGGWWALGVARSQLTDGLAGVPMSEPGTCRATVAMLEQQGADVVVLPELDDVDTLADALQVAGHPDCGERFAAAVAALDVASERLRREV